MGLLRCNQFTLFYMTVAVTVSANYAQKVIITPESPILRVGASLNLSCESSCPNSRPEWMALDNSDTVQTASLQRNVLHIASVDFKHEGKYFCSAKSCGQKSVKLLVYDFPVPVLFTVPVNPVTGQAFNLTCTLGKVVVKPYISYDMQLFQDNDNFKLDTKVPENNCDGYTCTHSLLYRAQVQANEAFFLCKAEVTIGGVQTFIKRENLTVHFQDLPSERWTTTTNPTTRHTNVETRHFIDTSKTSQMTTSKWMTSRNPESAVRTTEKDTITVHLQRQTKTIDVMTSTPSQMRTSDWMTSRNPVSAFRTTSHPSAIREEAFEEEKNNDAGDNTGSPATAAPQRPLNSNVPNSRKSVPEVEGKEEASNSPSTTMIAGSTVGSVATLSSLGFLAHLIRRRRRQFSPVDP